MTNPSKREFPVHTRGELRDSLLESLRWNLARLTNPKTGVAFTDDEIAAATSPGTREYARAEAIDLVVGMASEARAMFVVDQTHPRTANTWFLDHVWGPLAFGRDAPDGGRLPAGRAAGRIRWEATPGTLFVGSTTIPDEFAHVVDIKGQRFQVLFSEQATAAGYADLYVRAIDGGAQGNVALNTKGRGVISPAGAVPEGVTVIVADFAGGRVRETDDEFSRRIEDELSVKQAPGSPAQIRSWGRKADVNVLDVYVYPCALHAGTVRVAVLQKRVTEGPTALIASLPVIASVQGVLTAPAAEQQPVEPIFVTTTATPSNVDVAIGLRMRPRSRAGWTDGSPWPAVAAKVTVVTTQLDFRIEGVSAPISIAPGSSVPALMLWNNATSKFELLSVSAVTLVAGTTWRVQLAAAPTATVVVGTRVSADNGKRDAIAATIEQYFDSLGPGELVASTDVRYWRAFRRPSPDLSAPMEPGSSLATWLEETLGTAASQEAVSFTPTTPSPAVPSDAGDPPEKLVVRHVGVYPL